ncbi:hypothetical protein G5C51_13965 [Streptomyces sp. A7024]|uniref:Uncharacterized protein n=1 Tax=Streptomyces coryli TaxID=1128680 RepID=A0A6G4U139_9ACTN|nr:hypothetical protein [Streptomyces coryli]NGN64997.1 hypothetical protein [Streptomyces coryli]
MSARRPSPRPRIPRSLIWFFVVLIGLIVVAGVAGMIYYAGLEDVTTTK